MRLAVIASLAVLLAEPVHALNLCSKVPPFGQRLPGWDFMIGTATSDTLLAGPGSVAIDRRQVRDPSNLIRPVYGQAVDIERIGPRHDGLPPNVTKVVLVPWGYGADCSPLPWAGSTRWVEPGTRGLYSAQLRKREHWANGKRRTQRCNPSSNGRTPIQNWCDCIRRVRRFWGCSRNNLTQEYKAFVRPWEERIDSRSVSMTASHEPFTRARAQSQPAALI